MHFCTSCVHSTGKPLNVLLKASMLSRLWCNLLSNSSNLAHSIDEALKHKLEEETNGLSEEFPDKTEFIQKLGSGLNNMAVENMAHTKNG